jgi:hypothetical protein
MVLGKMGELERASEDMAGADFAPRDKGRSACRKPLKSERRDHSCAEERGEKVFTHLGLRQAPVGWGQAHLHAARSALNPSRSPVSQRNAQLQLAGEK